MKKNLVLFVQGGAGDVLAHTPAIRAFRRKYPDDQIIVLSTYMDLLKNNPNIDVLLNSETMEDFYGDYIHNKQVRFFKKHFVYDGFYDEKRFKSACLPEFICRMYDIDYDGEPLDYFVTDYERKAAKTFLDQYNYPVILLHATGSIPSEDGLFNKTLGHKDLKPEIIAPLVQEFSANPEATAPGKFYFIQIGLQGEPVVPGAVDALGTKMREAIALIEQCHSFIFIESLFAHCAAALNKKGIVVFQNTDPEFFGYSNAYNVHFSGGCKDWPCNRPLGAVIDIQPGFKNPKTRERPLWTCPNQLCANMPPENLREVFVEANLGKVAQPKGGGALTLDEVRKK